MQLATDHHLLETLRFELSQCRIYSRGENLDDLATGVDARQQRRAHPEQFHRIVHNDRH